jgi:hypothetical protein
MAGSQKRKDTPSRQSAMATWTLKLIISHKTLGQSHHSYGGPQFPIVQKTDDKVLV